MNFAPASRSPAHPAPQAYQLGNRISFLPLQMPGSNAQIRFQRAAMPRLGIPPRQVAKGVLLNEVSLPYASEEEVPSAGTFVQCAW